jgi:hypothetical protein
MLLEPTTRIASFGATVTGAFPSITSGAAFPARRQSRLLRPVLAYAVIALLAVTGAGLLGEHGVSAPLPCGENLAMCAAP